MARALDQLTAYFRARDDWAIRVRYHFAWVFDLSNVTKASATQRKALAEHLNSYEEFSARWNAGSAPPSSGSHHRSTHTKPSPSLSKQSLGQRSSSPGNSPS
jgi:hypothetical protein